LELVPERGGDRARGVWGGADAGRGGPAGRREYDPERRPGGPGEGFARS